MASETGVTSPAFLQRSPEVTVAEVHAGGRVTRYARAGRGRSVLLLAPPDAGEYAGMISTIVQDARVLAPWVDTTPDGAVDGGTGSAAPQSWLSLFLDGMGLTSLPVLGLGSLAVPALHFARENPGRVTRLALLPTPGPDGVDPILGAPRPSPRAAVPLLVMSTPGPLASGHPEARAVVGFLLGLP